MATPPVSGVQFWYAADQITSPPASGSKLSSWNDLSGNGNTASQATSGEQPVYDTNQQNGLPGVVFNGTSDRMGTVTLLSGPFTIYAVAKATSLSNYGAIIGAAANGVELRVTQTTGVIQLLKDNVSVIAASVGAVAANVPFMVVASYGNSGTGTWTFRLNGAADSTGTSTIVTAAADVILGFNAATSADYFKGPQFETLVYNAVHTLPQMQTVEAYLQRWFPAPAPPWQTQPMIPILPNVPVGSLMGQMTPDYVPLPPTFLWLYGTAEQQSLAATAAGSYGFTGSAAGITQISATAAGQCTFIGAATGTVDITATAAGSYSYTGNATGITQVPATAAGGYEYDGTATGVTDVSATGAGAYSYAGTATGTVDVSASGTGAYDYTGTATGVAEIPAAGAGAYEYDGSVSPILELPATASGAYSCAGTAAGTPSLSATATGAYFYEGGARGSIVVVGEAIPITNVTIGSRRLPGVGLGGTPTITLGSRRVR